MKANQPPFEGGSNVTRMWFENHTQASRDSDLLPIICSIIELRAKCVASRERVIHLHASYTTLWYRDQTSYALARNGK